MDALIGGPLSAAAGANASMAMTQTKFMLETCFTKVHVEATAAVKGLPAVIDPITGNIESPEIISAPAIPAHDNYKPVMIMMSLTRGVLMPGSPAIARDPNNPDSKDIPATAAQIQNISTQFDLPLLTLIPLSSLAVDTVNVDFEMEVKSCFLEPREQGSYGAESVNIHGLPVYDSSNPSSRDKHYEKPKPFGRGN